MKTPGIAVLATLVLSVSFGGHLLYGQEEPSKDRSLMDDRYLFLRNHPSPELPFELFVNGVRATTRQEMGPMDSDGTYVRADEFRIDTGFDVAEAVGNVTIVVRDGDTIITMKADRLTIEEPRQ